MSCRESAASESPAVMAILTAVPRQDTPRPACARFFPGHSHGMHILQMTNRLLTILAPSVLIASSALAQKSAKEIPAAISAIREADLRRDVTEMAGPDMRGREGGTIDEMRASMWLADVYRKIGLKPLGENGTYFQWFDMTRTRVSTTASRASIGGQAMNLSARRARQRNRPETGRENERPNGGEARQR